MRTRAMVRQLRRQRAAYVIALAWRVHKARKYGLSVCVTQCVHRQGQSCLGLLAGKAGCTCSISEGCAWSATPPAPCLQLWQKGAGSGMHKTSRVPWRVRACCTPASPIAPLVIGPRSPTMQLMLAVGGVLETVQVHAQQACIGEWYLCVRASGNLGPACRRPLCLNRLCVHALAHCAQH